ncbi:signal peptidase I [Candidatus Karelsulcia muelleri]|uniref:signal peptidase I n=1 Tax=Candidatus Karelsulcia muelleri TaxID=336810 RepID=UPI002169208C|nr:signal peptidase I [Candidatus Karelsulcia muelleri]
MLLNYNILLFLIIIKILYFLGTYNLYLKNGRNLFVAVIPIYNLIILMKILNRPIWWSILLYIPIIFFFIYPILCLDIIKILEKCSKKDKMLLLITLGGYIIYLNINPNPNPNPNIIIIKKRSSSIFFSIIFTSIINIYIIQPFGIHTPSMKDSLLVGDFLFVSKLHYGIRIPITQLSIPLIHNNFLGIQSYISYLRLPYIRLPCFQQINHNDIIVFNFPNDLKKRPLDKKDYYLKRCIGLPGDILSIKNGLIYINGILDNKVQKKIKKYILPKNLKEYNIYPENKLWNRDNYGPIYIPKKGDYLNLNLENISFYKDLITKSENSSLKIKKKKIFINNKVQSKYLVNKNYYFMLGDNKNNSLDSRYWGLIPYDHIVGKPLFIWLSISKNELVRWNRCFTIINSKTEKKYYIYHIMIIIIIYEINYLCKRRRISR